VVLNGVSGLKRTSDFHLLHPNRASKLLAYVLPIAAISPSLMWIVTDRSVWPWDQAWYGRWSVELFYTLVRSPSKWLSAMLGPHQKAPGIFWAGQFFVPLGNLVHSIDVGLLLSVLITQSLVLVLMYLSIKELSGGKILVAVAGCVVIASAPLFVGLSHQYLVEPMQTLAVAWFAVIMSFAPRWGRARILSHLVAAASFAMLAKVSSPLYCLGPGLLAVGYALHPKPANGQACWELRRLMAMAAFGLFLGLATVAWYYRNAQYVLSNASSAFSGPVAELYGKADTFVNNMIYWLSATRQSFFLPQVAVVVALIFTSGCLVRFAKRQKPTDHLTVGAVVAVVQIAAVYAVFSLSQNRDARFLLPLLPYVAILICWATTQVDRPVLSTLAIAIFSVQLALVHGQALGIIEPNPTVSHWAYAPSADAENATTLNSIVSRTCSEEDNYRYNMVGVELPWLNLHSVSFYAAKSLAPRDIHCYYETLGYAESDPDRAWSKLLSLNTLYYITVDPALLPVPSDPFNQVAVPVLERVRNSGLFEEQAPIANDPRILIFRAIQVPPSASAHHMPACTYRPYSHSQDVDP
jgi:hypothetical protein